IAHTTAKGELVNISSQFIPAPSEAARNGQPDKTALLTAPPISARQALVITARNVGQELEDEKLISTQAPAETTMPVATAIQRFNAPGLKGPAEVKLVWLPMNTTQMRLCWEVIFMSRARGEMFRTLLAV